MEADRARTKTKTRVIAETRLGEIVYLGGEVPTETSEDVSVRGALIRHLMLGGRETAPVSPKSVQIRGARVPDELDLQGCASELDLFLAGCGFGAVPVLRDARLGAVLLPGCHVPGFYAHRLRVTRGILLKQGSKAAVGES